MVYMYACKREALGFGVIGGIRLVSSVTSFVVVIRETHQNMMPRG